MQDPQKKIPFTTEEMDGNGKEKKLKPTRIFEAPAVKVFFSSSNAFRRSSISFSFCRTDFRSRKWQKVNTFWGNRSGSCCCTLLIFESSSFDLSSRRAMASRSLGNGTRLGVSSVHGAKSSKQPISREFELSKRHTRWWWWHMPSATVFHS